MDNLQLSSILLGSKQPDVLREWYRKVLAPDHDGDGPILLGGLMLVIDGRDDIATSNPEPGRMILNFHVDDFDGVESRLQSAGVEWLEPVADRPVGRFGTFTDPDGNYLQVIQFKDGHP
jgi:hypothetical protein